MPGFMTPDHGMDTCAGFHGMEETAPLFMTQSESVLGVMV